MICRVLYPFIGLNICLLLPVSVVGQSRPEDATSKSCRVFVASFYAWYAPIAKADHKGFASDLAWEKRPALFTKDLVALLREESEAQNRAGADLVNLDADPFLGADGAGERYVVKKTTTKGDTCWAEVHAVWDGKEDAGPDVTPQLALKNEQWVFVNFYFPSPYTASSWNVLNALTEARKEWIKRGLIKGQSR
jgi:hypothetical protein